MTSGTTPHALLIFAGLDPSGGAGLVADVQAAGAMGQHPLAVATTLTAQGLRAFEAQYAVDAATIEQQARAAIRDFDVQAVKLGAVPTRATLHLIAHMVNALSPSHFVVDPVRSSSSGGELFDDVSVDDYKHAILPLNPVLTPNRAELDQMCHALTMQGQARELIEQGARAVLVTDGDGSGEVCKHSLFSRDFEVRVYHHERLPGTFRGTGCMLTTALAAALMRGETLSDAVQTALDYTLEAIRHAYVTTADGEVSVPARVIPR